MSYSGGGKRALDIILAVAIALISVVPLLICCLLIPLSSPGPIFFLQARVGQNEKEFFIFKLRSMRVNANRSFGQTGNNDPEVFLFGRFLRRSKLDELPQIYNVIIGDMSLVGPRPCLKASMSEMSDKDKRRFEVRPGITGLAQIRGNASLSWQERWACDLEYVDRISLLLDLKIILRTFLVVLVGEERFKSRI